jgi:hypothetical protein
MQLAKNAAVGIENFVRLLAVSTREIGALATLLPLIGLHDRL